MTGDISMGDFGGEEVFYNPITGIVTCKDIKVYRRALVLFQQSDRVRAILDEHTTISRTETTYKIGCLEDTARKFNSLISKADKLH